MTRAEECFSESGERKELVSKEERVFSTILEHTGGTDPSA